MKHQDQCVTGREHDGLSRLHARSSSHVHALTFALSLILMLSSCVPALKVREAKREVPASYALSTDTLNAATTAWRTFFNDPDLRTLIDSALANNQELNIVALEVDIARNEIMARRGEYLPRVGFGLGAGIEKVGLYTSKGASDEASGVAQHLPSFAFGFTASWELDIWSKLRSATW